MIPADLVSARSIVLPLGESFSCTKSTRMCPFVQEVYGKANPIAIVPRKEMSSTLPTIGCPRDLIVTSTRVVPIMHTRAIPETAKSEKSAFKIAALNLFTIIFPFGARVSVARTTADTHGWIMDAT